MGFTVHSLQTSPVNNNVMCNSGNRVPNPEAPSIKHPNNQAIKITWIRLSGLILEKPFLMVVIAPEYFKVFKSKIAPKIIQRILKVIIKPWIDEATILEKVTPQKKYAIKQLWLHQ